jgi:hypothetical protein
LRTSQDRRPGEELLWDSPIDRTKLEERTLAGLKDRMMTPEVAEEAMHAYAEETNRFNRERRANSEGWRTELVKVEKGYHRDDLCHRGGPVSAINESSDGRT